ncbi:BTB/POZ domain-containing protein 1 isoform X3 [Mastacembelus armatus]|uniref:BTB/POZ domain-containing protein 1 isoform X3 n=1 Tax=Mastacembelus armatus TaxID=205130 RepID=UPI000E456624|nr:BTB/POZ domain-containing protein 1 isoform X3 [Mastacembelus armatus]
MATGSGGSGLASNHDGQEAASTSAQSGAAAPLSSAPTSPPVLGLHREPMYNWQATKSSLKERFAFLFNNELLSDVRFIVGKGRQAQRIPAHKFVLAAGSAVFDAMFNGGMATTSAEIELPDVEPAAFLALLRFLYSDEVHIGPETVMTTLYTAKKYAVPALEGHCVEFLTKHLRADNAFMLLTQARLFDEPQLASLCLDTIDKSTADAINAEGFTDIDLVNPKPRVDYIDRPRCCLRGEECSINRFQQVESRWGYSGTSDRIRFNVNRRISIVGFGLYGSIHGPTDYQVNIQIIESDKRITLGQNDTGFSCDGTANTFRVMFKEPVEILPSVSYTACATLKGPDSHYGTKGLKKVTQESATGTKTTFFFFSSPGNNNGTSVEDGQIPEIIYYT